MPKTAIIRTAEKLLEPVTGNVVSLSASDLLAVWDFFDVDRESVAYSYIVVPYACENEQFSKYCCFWNVL